MLARPLATEGRPLVLVVGISLADRDETLSNLVRSFLIGVPVAVLLASGIGYWLATCGLAPVEAMRRRAKRVSLEPAASGCRSRPRTTRSAVSARRSTRCSPAWRTSFQRERRFVADASHELRTPLAVLKTELEAADSHRRRRSPRCAKSLVVALEETDHLAQLADDLLLIARAADGRLPVQSEEVDVHELLERTRQRFADRAREQGREIRVDAPDGRSVSVDPLRARQALGNLVDNALRHGAGEIRLSARRRPRRIEIDVERRRRGLSGRARAAGVRALRRAATASAPGAARGSGWRSCGRSRRRTARRRPSSTPTPRARRSGSAFRLDRPRRVAAGRSQLALTCGP